MVQNEVMVFERFLSSFHMVPSSQEPRAVWAEPRLLSVRGYRELAGRFAGCSFENGLYRLHDADSAPRIAAVVDEAFPAFAGRACAFGYDWLGRQFAIDRDRLLDDQPLVLLMEPGTGEALEVPLTFEAFHDELVDIQEAALARTFFTRWANLNPASLPVGQDQCAGYRVPLFLGGSDTVENLELIDLEVYWSLCGQLRRGTLNLPAGTSIREVSVGD